MSSQPETDSGRTPPPLPLQRTRRCSLRSQLGMKAAQSHRFCAPMSSQKKQLVRSQLLTPAAANRLHAMGLYNLQCLCLSKTDSHICRCWVF